MSSRNCPHCSKQVPIDAKICPECGFSIAGFLFKQEESVGSKRASSSEHDVMGLEPSLAYSIICFPPIGLLAYFFYRKNHPKAAKKAISLALKVIGVEVCIGVILLILFALYGENAS
ncbi:MAG: zinc ribbon domain-containing protein [Candidatus Hodarchaeales archaeon]|jgi:uncharacterized membrane protein YvbJ